ncbi:MAG: hypothetical protein ACRDQA_11920 [Nocardioidaceae bacterium]
MTPEPTLPERNRTARHPRYRYVVADLLTDRVLADLPLTGVTFDRRISRAGSLRGSMDVPDTETARTADQVARWSGRLSLWVLREGEVWWGGVLWTTSPSRDSKGRSTMSVQAATFESYADRRIIRDDITYDGWDQGTIIPDLWRRLQDRPEGDVGVVARNQQTGIHRDRHYLASDAASYEKRIEEIGDVIDGPEFTIDVGRDTQTGVFTRTLRLGQLKLGTGGVGLLVTGVRLPQWTHTNDATQGGTTFQTRGDSRSGNAGAEKQPLLSHVFESTKLLDEGWPLLDVTEDFSSVIHRDVLDNHARALRAKNSGQSVSVGYSAYIGDTGWEPNRVGEYVRIKYSKDDLWNPGGEELIRPVAVEVTPPSRGGQETVKLIIGEDES